jgi:neutral ceramidase
LRTSLWKAARKAVSIPARLPENHYNDLIMRKFMVCLLAAISCGAAEFRFGRAEVSITPTKETGGVKKLLDDLRAKAVVFEKDGTAAAMVACDLPVINLPVVQAARRLIETQTGIPAANVMISATHTHTGLTPGWTGQSSWPALTPAQGGNEMEEARRYTKFLVKSIAQAVVSAHNDLQPAIIFAGVGREDSLPFNRRFLMKDGTVLFNPGVLNPNIVRPVGPIDPEVPVGYVATPGGRPLATLVNYAMHLDTVGGDAYSADYPHFLAQSLGAAKGPEMMTFFSVGACGNVNHIDVTRPGPYSGYGEAARIGTILAAAVLKTYPKLERLEPESIGVTRETVPLPPVILQSGDSEKARSYIEREKAGGKLTLLESVFTQRVLFAERQQGRPLDVEVMAIALGKDLAWVALPGEIFVELGLAIKRGSPYRFTTISELAYDWIRYVPNRKGFAEGHYEAINTRSGPGGGEALAEAAIRCLLKLHGAN